MARGHRSNKRKFVWARQDGVLLPEANSAEDLLTQFKAQGGAHLLLGATVVAVRGYIRPNVADAVFSKGRVGIRICNEGDTGDTAAGDVGPVGDGDLNDWMGWFPWLLDQVGSAQLIPNASWNHAANPWAVDLRAQRKMEEINDTLGIFAETIAGSGEYLAIDYDLSVGFKLP